MIYKVTQRELEERASSIIRECDADGALVRAYASYVILNYDELEKPTMLSQRNEPKDRLCCQMRVPTPGENALLRRIEEAKKKETFSDTLLRLMRERGKTAPELYRAAGVDSRHFSKINSNRDYKPSKETVCAFAIALNLTLSEAEELLEKAGFAFSSSILFDVTVSFFLENRCYDRKKIDLIMEKMGIQLMPQNF